MKTTISKKLVILLALMVINLAGTFAQGGSLSGWIGDKSTAIPLPYATIIVECNGKLIAATAADLDGEYILLSLAPGYYDVKASFVGYQTYLLKSVSIKQGVKTTLDIMLETPGYAFSVPENR